VDLKDVRYWLHFWYKKQVVLLDELAGYIAIKLSTSFTVGTLLYPIAVPSAKVYTVFRPDEVCIPPATDGYIMIES
jgi:hypothetical protein